MSDEGAGMDPCECIWSHELAMRRLLNMLRNSQGYCTDSECFDESVPRESVPDKALLMILILTVSLFLFYFRPRNQVNAVEKRPNNDGHDSNGAPPSVPPPSI